MGEDPATPYMRTFSSQVEAEKFNMIRICKKLTQKADLDGIIVPFLHSNDLLASKKAVGRPKDQLDVLELGKIKKYLDGQSLQ